MKSFIQYSKSILLLLGNRKKLVPWLILIFLFSSLLEVIGIGLIAPFIALIINPDSFLESSNLPFKELFLSYDSVENLVILFGFVLILVFTIKTVSVIFINFLIIKFAYTQEIKLRSFLMSSYQSLQYPDYVKRNSAEYIYNINNLASQFSQGIVQSWLRLFSEGIVTISIFCLLAFTDIYSLLSLVAIVGLLLIVYWTIFNVKLKNLGKKSNDSNRLMVKSINEGMTGFKEIRILQKEQYFFDKVYESSNIYSDAGILTGVIQSMPRYLLELVLIIFVFLIIYVSLLLEMDLNLIIPTLGLFAVAAIRLLPSINQIMNSILALRQGQNSLDILVEDYSKFIYKPNSEVINSDEMPKRKLTFNQIEFRGINFKYFDSYNNVLENVNFIIKSGESIGIMGPSGGGKTTLIDVMLGLLEPLKGEVLINKINIFNILDEWRSKVAYLPQEVFLIDDTLRQNIVLEGNKKLIDEEKLQKAIHMSQLNSLINELPNGLNTIVGDKGIMLSGGQRQRVSLARAFYYDRDVLVMDESTSALDQETEKEIINEIKFLHGKKTLIVIAHSISTLKNCDHIFKIQDGSVHQI